jgi:hypothetical protein
MHLPFLLPFSCYFVRGVVGGWERAHQPGGYFFVCYSAIFGDWHSQLPRRSPQNLPKILGPDSRTPIRRGLSGSFQAQREDEDQEPGHGYDAKGSPQTGNLRETANDHRPEQEAAVA